MNYLDHVFATQIDFRFDRATNQYRALHLTTDPRYVLYRDGRSRITTEKEIRKQLKSLTNKQQPSQGCHDGP